MAVIEVVFSRYDQRLQEMARYIEAMTPCIGNHLGSMPLFVESTVVLVATHFQTYLDSLIGTGTQDRQPAIRRHLMESGNDSERVLAQTCDLPTLAKMAKRRLSLEKGGSRIETIFHVMFGSSPWPSPEVKAAVSDLILVRNVIIHAGGSDVGSGPIQGAYVTQIQRTGLFTSRTYGDLAVYRLEYVEVLRFLADVLHALEQHIGHMKQVLGLK